MYTKESIPDETEFKHYRKTALCKALRIDGPFEVKTRDGTLSCPNGYLALDSEGWPYPIAKEEFEKIYEPADEEAKALWNK